MKKVKNCYQLTNQADFDISEIFDYTEELFGVEQAIKYTEAFISIFEHLLINSTIGKHRLEIDERLFSIAKEEHTIFYEILENSILIIRVLHSSRDFPKHFK